MKPLMLVVLMAACHLDIPGVPGSLPDVPDGAPRDPKEPQPEEPSCEPVDECLAACEDPCAMECQQQCWPLGPDCAGEACWIELECDVCL